MSIRQITHHPKSYKTPYKASDPDNNKRGQLYIVATPIGNLGDMSQRAIQTLSDVELILAEDTRKTRKLTSHFGISTPLQSLHEHNEQERAQTIVDLLQQGQHIALVSDAGTPLISDPGYRLVTSVADANVNIIPIPGASAVITALSIAGLPTDRFMFEGFLPAKQPARQAYLKNNYYEMRTQVYYESSHRIHATLKDIQQVFGDKRHIVIARELTKLYEDIFRGTIAQAHDWLVADTHRAKGEFVLIIAGNPEPPAPATELIQTNILTTLLGELPVKQAAHLTAKITGQAKNAVYKQALQSKNNK
ncbi:MAG TPA: 16S rRNA (cytidine(1402)-2'-O)-methyltransferase [Thiothrix sp.]|nr:16S rRNA (cytidine(1402)-2'-O)-methyltransferase [Thiothrix sp.]